MSNALSVPVSKCSRRNDIVEQVSRGSGRALITMMYGPEVRNVKAHSIYHH